MPSVDDDQLKAVLSELLRHADLSIEIGLSACRQLNGTGRYEACELGLKELLSRFAGSRHVGRVHAERLQAAVQRLPIPDAIDYTTKFFDDDDISSNLDNDASKSIQLLLWEQAAKCNDAGQWNMCLEWYNQSLRLFRFGQTDETLKTNQEKSENISKLYRNKATCLLNMDKLEEAESAAKCALNFNQDSMLSQFTLFKVLVARGKEPDAIKCVSALVENPNDKQIQRIDGHKFDVRHALVCLAAQHALEKCQRDVAMATLQHLASSGRNDKAKLTANRCLIRLYLTICDGMEHEVGKDESSTEMESEDKTGVEPMELDEKSAPLAKDRNSLMESAIQCVKNAHQVLISLKSDSKLEIKPDANDDVDLVLPGNESHLITEEKFGNEVTWFMKITWNMALQFNGNSAKMKELFLLCKEILALATVDQSILLRQKTCLLMCAACGLASARNASGKIQTEELQDVLNIVGQCREICRDLAGYQDASSTQNEDKSTVLLLLYNFEALAKLTRYVNREEPQALQDLFQEICRLSQSDAKTFETVAALSMESPAHHPEICKLALKTALKYTSLSLEQEPAESEKLVLLKKRSSLYRLLIETLLSESSPIDLSSKDESWMCFNEVYQLVQSKNNEFPELDCLWFTVRCWNIGVRLFTANHVIEAEKWCALALRLLAQLDRFKENYETLMNRAYREILAKKDIISRSITVF